MQNIEIKILKKKYYILNICDFINKFTYLIIKQ